jgi:hypothetical protein
VAFAANAEGGPVNVRALSLEPQPIRIAATCTITWDLLS